MTYCRCHETLTFKQAKDGLLDEVKEFIDEPSKDEGSDIVYCINRMVGSFVGKPYVKIIPGDKLHIQKIEKRMNDYGCIRSERHLIFGVCPSVYTAGVMYVKVEDWCVVGVHNARADSDLVIGADLPMMTDGIYVVGKDDDVSYTFIHFFRNRAIAKSLTHSNN